VAALSRFQREAQAASAVSLLRGIWRGDGWSAHAGDVTALSVTFLAFTAVSVRVFRWE